jgi:Pyridoxamine 5'-phosphate oxidase
MASWSEVEAAVPELAAKVRRRFERDVVALMASLRRDGGPRISGIETTFGAGELWLGMMPGSLKVADLLRDPRIALHCATVDKDVAAGDAKIAGAARLVEDEATFAAFTSLRADGGQPVPPGSFPLFRIDVKEMSFLEPAGDHLDIQSWSEAAGYRQVDRY